MAIPLYPLFVRRWFNRAFNNGETTDYASLDAIHADIIDGYNKVVQRVNLISTSTGLITTLTSITTFTATASQTAFTVTDYSTTDDIVVAYTNAGSGNLLRIPTASITKTDATTVTLPAQVVGATVIIEVFTPGNGTTQLASTSAGQGASLVGIEDSAALFSATTVEGALAEAAANLASSAYLGGVIGISNYIKKDGTIAFTGNQSMGSHKITNLSAGTVASNDAARMADITSAQLQSILGAYLAGVYLAIAGGTMSGNLSMGTHSITNLANGASAQDAVTKAQLDLKLALAGGTMTGDINANSHTVTGLANAVAATDAVPLSQAQGLVTSFSRQSDYVVAGANSFVVPAGVSKIKARMYGGGAGGASASPGGGGYGGAYAEAFLTVAAAETLTLGIGAAGATSGGPGGDSTIARGASVLLKAAGGTISAGGDASSPAGETFFGIRGGQPGPAGALSGGILAHGNGGDAPQGGSGGLGAFTAGATTGADGTFPGGGGGGGASGGIGGSGRVTIFY